MNSDQMRIVWRPLGEVLCLLASGKRQVAMVKAVLQAIIDKPEFGGEIYAQLVPGSDLGITPDDCNRFLRDWCGLERTEWDFLQAEEPTDVPHWPIPVARELTYDKLRELFQSYRVPVMDWTLKWIKRAEEASDCRQPDQDFLLWTPAGIEATKACPELRGVSYHQLWTPEYKSKVVTLREQLILWLLVYWKTDRGIQLDQKGWTRSGSRVVNGGGLGVYSGGDGLDVDWLNPGFADPFGGSRSVVLG